MVLKRHFTDGGEDQAGSGFSGRDSKRGSAFAFARWAWDFALLVCYASFFNISASNEV